MGSSYEKIFYTYFWMCKYEVSLDTTVFFLVWNNYMTSTIRVPVSSIF